MGHLSIKQIPGGEGTYLRGSLIGTRTINQNHYSICTQLELALLLLINPFLLLGLLWPSWISRHCCFLLTKSKHASSQTSPPTLNLSVCQLLFRFLKLFALWIFDSVNTDMSVVSFCTHHCQKILDPKFYYSLLYFSKRQRPTYLLPKDIHQM